MSVKGNKTQNLMKLFLSGTTEASATTFSTWHSQSRYSSPWAEEIAPPEFNPSLQNKMELFDRSEINVDECAGKSSAKSVS